MKRFVAIILALLLLAGSACMASKLEKESESKHSQIAGKTGIRIAPTYTGSSVGGVYGNTMSYSQAKSIIEFNDVSRWNTSGRIRYIQQYFSSGGTWYRSKYWWEDGVKHNCDYASAYMAVSYMGIDVLPQKKLNRNDNTVVAAVADQNNLTVETINNAAQFREAYNRFTNGYAYGHGNHSGFQYQSTES